MPGQTPCPIADVDRALSAYINTREDTLRIRRTIARYLTSSLRPVNPATQNHHLKHEAPFGLSAASTNPPGLKNRRLEYLQALRAQNQAQSKHHELQASLQHLQLQHLEEGRLDSVQEHDPDATQDYITLLRQRRRLAELQAIQASLNQLLTVKPLKNALADPRAAIKEALGEPPDLPAERIEQLSGAQDDQAHVFKLKQEVLEAKTSMEQAQDARAKVQAQAQAQAGSESKPTPSLPTQVRALEHARDEMVEWVQGELAKLEEESIFLEDASPIKRTPPPLPTQDPLDLASAESRIKTAYTHYTAARATLLSAYQSFDHPPSSLMPLQLQPQPQISPPNSNSNNKNNNNNNNNPTTHPFTRLTPHLPSHIHTATQTRALLAHTVYQSTHLASAHQALHTTLLRLAAESHMLPAAAATTTTTTTTDLGVRARAWAHAARDAEAATEAVVAERVAACRREIQAVDAVVALCAVQAGVLDVG